MRRFLLILVLVSPSTVWAAADTGTARELAEMKKQLSDLTRYVKTLETRLAAQEKGGAAAPAPTKGEGDALEDAERELGYSSGGGTEPKVSTDKAGSSKAAPASAGAGARDDLEAMEAQLGYQGKSSGQAASKAAAASAGTSEKPVLAPNYTLNQPTGGSGNARTYFNPLISVIGDFVYRNTHLQEGVVTGLDLDPVTGLPTNHTAGSANDNKFDFRELEVAFQSVVDPWTRLDVFLTLPGQNTELTDTAGALGDQHIEVEEAFITYNQLPWSIQLKGGKFRPEFGKENLAHTHVFFSIDRPAAVTNFFGPDGLKEYGLSLQKSFALGKDNRSVLELTLQGLTDVAEDSPWSGFYNHGLMWLGRARYYHEFDDSNNIDFGASHISGDWDRNEQREFDVSGLDLTYRHEPVTGGVYHKTIARAEYLRGQRDVTGFILDPATGLLAAGQQTLHPDGFYVMLNHQFQRNMYVGARYDDTDAAIMLARTASSDGFAPGYLVPHSRITGPSLWYEYETTEFNKFKIQYSHHDTDFTFADNRKADDALFFEWTVTVGPHGAHKY